MKHPEGLDISHFVTHNWNEGIFEFYNKVIHSVPATAHLWICFLANPQTWEWNELKELLVDVEKSPFVQALAIGKPAQMLIVPCAADSVYTRLWCVEEAKRAIELKIPVKLASQPTVETANTRSEDRKRACLQACCTVVLQGGGQVLGSLVGAGQLGRQAGQCIQSVCFCCCIGSNTDPVMDRTRQAALLDDRQGQMHGQANAGNELKQHFESVRNASCSDPSDEKMIRKSIQGQEAKIDAMINGIIGNSKKPSQQAMT
jgi:hypothetical protein